MASKRLISIASKQASEAVTVAVKTYYDSEYAEYSNVLVINCRKAGEDSTYYTTDKADAISTANDMLARASAIYQ